MSISLLNKIIILVILLVTGLALGRVNNSFAQSNAPKTPQNSKTSQYCKRANTIITKVLNQSAMRIAKRQKYVSDRKANIQARITALKNRGANVETLQADSQRFYALLDQWINDYQNYLSLIQNAKSISCTTSYIQFVSIVQSSRKQLKRVNKDSSTLKTYYKTTLNADFAVARGTIKKQGGVKSAGNTIK